MKFRQEHPDLSESDERALVDAVHALERDGGEEPGPSVSDAYWQNLIIRTNQRVDAVASGKAISISWAARVAIPGVVAIVSFLIALHYYVPVQIHQHSDVESVVLGLPDRVMDSLLTDSSLSEETLVVVAANEDLFDVPSEQIGDYLIENGNATLAVESLPEQQADQMLDLLAKEK
jgi:hypothetical protein